MKVLSYRLILGFIFFSYLIFLSLYFFTFNSGFSHDSNAWGAFGGFLGGALSPIIGLITIILTYNIIKGQEIQNRQNEFQYMYQLLFNSMEENRNIIKMESFGKRTYGRDALKKINKNIENLYRSLNQQEHPDKRKNFENAFWSVYEDVNKSSATYMKSIHNLLKVVDQDCLKAKRSTYTAMFRAQLHSEELKFILYNGIATQDFESFKRRIEEYSILKDLANSNDIDSSLKKRYTKNAFFEFKKHREENSFKICGYEIKINKINC